MATEPDVSIFRRKRQQDVAWHAAIARIPGIDEDHAAYNHRSGAIQRATLGLNSIYRGVFLLGVEVPEHFAVLRSERAYVAVDRAGKNRPGNQSERLRLPRRASRTRRNAGMAWRVPGLSSIFEMQCGQAAAFYRIKCRAANGPGGVHHRRYIGNGGVNFLIVAGHAPLHASVESSGPH